jgi:hypothetical protein
MRAISTRRVGSETNAAGKISPRISVFSTFAGAFFSPDFRGNAEQTPGLLVK